MYGQEIKFAPSDLTLAERTFDELLALFKQIYALSETEKKEIVKTYNFKNLTSLPENELVQFAALKSLTDDVTDKVTGLWLICYFSLYSEINLIELIYNIPSQFNDSILNEAPSHPTLQQMDIFYLACMLAINKKQSLLRMFLFHSCDNFNKLNFNRLLQGGVDSLLSKICAVKPRHNFIELLILLPEAVFSRLNIDRIFSWLFRAPMYEHWSGKDLLSSPLGVLSRISKLPEKIIRTIHFTHEKSSLNSDTEFNILTTLIEYLEKTYLINEEYFINFYFKLSAQQLGQWQSFFESRMSKNEESYRVKQLFEIHSFRWLVLTVQKTDETFNALLDRARKIDDDMQSNYCLYDLAQSWPMSESTMAAYLNVRNEQPILYSNSREALANFYFNKEENSYARRTSDLLVALKFSLQAFSVTPEPNYESLARKIFHTLLETNSATRGKTKIYDRSIVDWFETTFKLLKLPSHLESCESIIAECLRRANNQFVVDRIVQLECENQKHKNEINAIKKRLDAQQQQITLLLKRAGQSPADDELPQESSKAFFDK